MCQKKKNSIEQVTFQLTQSSLFIFVHFLKVDEGIQTIGHEVVAAPGDLWDTKPASAEYWYKKKGKGSNAGTSVGGGAGLYG